MKMMTSLMKMTNTRPSQGAQTTLSVHDRQSGRQANNLFADQLADAVRPWFDDWSDSGIREAIEALRVPDRRSEAAEFLGLDLIPVA